MDEARFFSIGASRQLRDEQVRGNVERTREVIYEVAP